MADPQATYVEDVALFFEEAGLPRIAGRILGLLLICDPPWRTAPQLAEELEASKGSVSTMTRMLMRAGLIEKVALPGARATAFQLTDDGFENMFAQQIAQVVAFRPIADRGLALLQGTGAAPERLKTLQALYAFFEREMPRLLEKWREERAQRDRSTR